MTENRFIKFARTSLERSWPGLKYIWLGTSVFLFCLVFNLLQKIRFSHEAWFLQVIKRVLSGDILYKDIFFGITPLSVYLSSVFVSIFGIEIMVTRVVFVLCLTFTIIFSILIARKLNLSRISQFVLGIVIVSFSTFSSNMYNNLAYTFFMISFYFIVCRLSSAEKKPVFLIMAGVSAGLCFSSKYTIGIYLIAALVLSIILETSKYAESLKRIFVNISILIISFVIPIFLTLLPVVLSGGFSKFLEYGFLAKGNYLKLGAVSYFDGFIKTGTFLTESSFDLKELGISFLHSVFFLPLALIPVLIWLSVKSKGRAKYSILLMFLFFVTAFLGIFPRADLFHLQFFIPILFVTFLFALKSLKEYFSRFSRFLYKATICWIVLAFTVSTVPKIRNVVSDDYQFSTFPHYRSIPVRKEIHQGFQNMISKIVSVARGRKAFFLTSRAGFFYLTTGLKNHTPFDYPFATAFGFYGQADVISAIESGKIDIVFMNKGSGGILSPVGLENYIENNMKVIGKIGILDVYEKEKNKNGL